MDGPSGDLVQLPADARLWGGGSPAPSERPLAGGKGWDHNISPGLAGERRSPGSRKPTMVPLRFPNLGVSQGLRYGGVPGNSGGPGPGFLYSNYLRLLRTKYLRITPPMGGWRWEGSSGAQVLPRNCNTVRALASPDPSLSRQARPHSPLRPLRSRGPARRSQSSQIFPFLPFPSSPFPSPTRIPENTNPPVLASRAGPPSPPSDQSHRETSITSSSRSIRHLLHQSSL